MHNWNLHLILGVSLAFLIAPYTHAAKPDALVRLPGHVLPALAQAKLVDPPAKVLAEEPLTLTLVLKRGDQVGFDKYLRDVYNPKSSDYRQFLTQSELSDRFGPSREAYDKVLNYLQSNGFTLVRGSENRLTLTVKGSRAQARQAFAVEIGDYTLGDRRFFANDRDPAVPSDIAEHIQATMGLSTLAMPRPSADLLFAQALANAYIGAAAQLEALAASVEATGAGGAPIGPGYVIPGGIVARWVALDTLKLALAIIAARLPLGKAMVNDQLFATNTPEQNTGQKVAPLVFNNVLLRDVANWLSLISPSPSLAASPPALSPATGAGQKIGLLAYSNFRPSDIADWLALSGKPASLINQVSQVHVNGGAPFGPGESDVLLGIGTLLTIAPGAQIVVYDGPFNTPGTSFQALFSAMINDGVTIISNSFVYCEDQTTLADVQSIDAILATAAASGISVFNATGDAGSVCKNASPNTIAVPANSPNATAVGGSSVTVGPGSTYVSESWWNGTSKSPPTGQGGFGVSRFFSRPFYQNGLISGPTRSVPDVVAPADPQNGPFICQANAGGCPTGRALGGTSLATPLWAGLTALLNDAQGKKLGFLNPQLYSLAGTNAFHSAAQLNSDVAHVGLGSPNGNLLGLGLRGVVAGPTDPSVSSVTASYTDPLLSFFGPVQADGKTVAAITVRLHDSDGNQVSGKTITLAASAGSNAVISPPSGVSSVADGTVVFQVTNLTPQPVTFTATNVSDGLVLQEQPSVTFSVPPAAGASISPPALTVTANGIDKASIAVTLKDALNRPTPGKEVRLSQGNGHSTITGPNPSVTDSNGQIIFTATNLVNEVVTYTAVDVTDGNLPIPGNAIVTFTNGSGGACGQNVTPPVGLNGYTVTPFATGFPVGQLFYGNINFGGCSGVAPLGFLEGSAYVPNFFNGDFFKLGLGGGAVSNANKLSTIAPTLGWVVAGKDGKLYATRTAVSQFPPNFTNGAIVELDPVTGAEKRTLVANLPCSQGLVVDPLSGDLFFDGQCFGAGANNANLFRVRNPGSATPALEVYATLPGSPNGQIAFSPKGTIYVVVNYLLANPPVYRISGTNVPGPPTVTLVPGVFSNYWLNIGTVDGSGEATALVTLNTENNVGRLKLTNITTNPPTIAAVMAEGTGGGTIGPDGCLYMPNSNVMHKLTDPTGGCSLLPTNAKPEITLTPAAISPNPAQGTAQTFTATIRNLSVPVGTPITLDVIGPNLQASLARTDASGQATFTYPGIFTGTDTLRATATVGSDALISNKAKVTWIAGKHTTFLTLNLSPTAGSPGQPVTVIASLTDVSVSPAVPLPGQTVTFTLGSAQCVGTTNSTGIASCTLVPSVPGLGILTASFAGNAQFLGASDSVDFNVVGQAAQTFPPGDLTCNGDVDLNDVNLLNQNLNKTVSQSNCQVTTCNTTCDLDGDGKITVLDARKLVLLCTRPRCAVR